MTQFKLVPVVPTESMTWAAVNAGGWSVEDLEKWRAMLAAAPSPWISVGERLPESPSGGGDLYLAWWDGDEGGCETSWYCGNAGWQHADGEMDYHRENDVTHWMPLPEAPGAKERSK